MRKSRPLAVFFIAACCASGPLEPAAAAVEYLGRNYGDPFGLDGETGIQASVQKPSLPDLNVEGLIWDTPAPQAIVNGSVVAVGDKIQEAEVLNITKQGVFLRYNGEEFVLRPRKKGAK